MLVPDFQSSFISGTLKKSQKSRRFTVHLLHQSHPLFNQLEVLVRKLLEKLLHPPVFCWLRLNGMINGSSVDSLEMQTGNGTEYFQYDFIATLLGQILYTVHLLGLEFILSVEQGSNLI
uniref:Uncharacterized protein n=1 Tax=Glossina austeni TaxID=7395 RepID=A0A1A9VM56_GLOAU